MVYMSGKIIALICLYSLISVAVSWISLEAGVASFILFSLLQTMISILKRFSQQLEVENETETVADNIDEKTRQKFSEVNQDVFAKFQTHLQTPLKARNQSQQQATTATSGTQSNKTKIQKKSKTAVKAKLASSGKQTFVEEMNLESSKDVINIQKSLAKARAIAQKTEHIVEQTKKQPKKLEQVLLEEKSSKTEKNSTSTTKVLPPSSPQSQIPVKSSRIHHEDEEDDLFADIHIPLAGESGNQGEEKHKNPIWEEDILENEIHRNSSSEDYEAESNALLQMAESAYAAKQWSSVYESLQNYFQALAQTNEEPTARTRYMLILSSLQVGNLASIGDHLQPLLRDQAFAKDPDYPLILEEMSQGLEKKQEYSFALLSLQSLLNHHRQQLNRIEMDQVYLRIEKALEVLGEGGRLIKVYENHLEIKRILKDRLGEIELLDAIGTQFYKMGNKEKSREYYEESLQLKNAKQQTSSTS